LLATSQNSCLFCRPPRICRPQPTTTHAVEALRRRNALTEFVEATCRTQRKTAIFLSGRMLVRALLERLRSNRGASGRSPSHHRNIPSTQLRNTPQQSPALRSQLPKSEMHSPFKMRELVHPEPVHSPFNFRKQRMSVVPPTSGHLGHARVWLCLDINAASHDPLCIAETRPFRPLQQMRNDHFTTPNHM
jgi:hypothetical protein